MTTAYDEGTPVLAGTQDTPVRVTALIDHLAMGGAEMLLSQFARVADSAGIELSVTCLGELAGNPAAIPLREAGIEARSLGLPIIRPDLRALTAVRRHLDQTRPDVLHTHLGTADLVGGLAARSLGIPPVSTLHTVVWPDDLKFTAARVVVAACARRFIAVSDAARRAYAAQIYGPERRIVTIHNGIDVTPEPGSGRSVRAEFGIGADETVIGMVSSLRPEKAHDLALRCLTIVRERHPGVRLLIVGGGSMAEAISARIDELGLADAVTMAGPRYDVMRCYDAFDLCLHPSHAEAFPTTILEAMAARVPVIATAVGGIPEIVVDGETGRLVPPRPGPSQLADAASQLLQSPDRRRQMGDAARRRYEVNFTARPWAQRTRALYEDVLAGAQVAPAAASPPAIAQ